MVNEAFEYTVVRKSRRRTASIQISRQNQISVIVPKWISKNQIEEIVRQKNPWIRKRLRLNEEYQRLNPRKEFKNGELYYYLGETYELVIHSGSDREEIVKEGKSLRVFTRSDSEIRERLEAWYAQSIESVLGERVPFYERLLNVQAREVRIKNLETQWGNCRTGEVLTFNWKMVMAPLPIVDYIVVHELCHLIHLNHSPKFWKAVASVYPEYVQVREWLRRNGEKLDF